MIHDKMPTFVDINPILYKLKIIRPETEGGVGIMGTSVSLMCAARMDADIAAHSTGDKMEAFVPATHARLKEGSIL